MRAKRLLPCVALLVLLLSAGAWAETEDKTEQEPAGYVALTFDDGPSGALTQRLLDGLRERGAKATFFLCGYRMEQYPDAMERYLEEGHELGVHSTVHTDLTKLTPEQLREDMAGTAQMIEEMTGIWPVLMRPPGGAYDEKVLREAEQEGMRVILWSVDPRDWATHDARQVLSTMAREAGDGDVILMHDMSKSSVDAALRLIDELQEKGFCFVTVSELAERKGVSMTAGSVYEDFKEK